MKKSFLQKIIHKVREKTPLSIRQKIGPVLGYSFYLFNTYVRVGLKTPHVLSINDTISLILKNNLSVIRFGDGEISLLDGMNIGFQKSNSELVQRLETIFKTNTPGLLIAIPGIWGKLDNFDHIAYWFYAHHLYRHWHIWKKLLSYTQIYGDTNMTRHYLAYKDRSRAGQVFKNLFLIWKGKDIVIIEGSKSRLGLGNDMFNECKSIKRLLCPPENSYSKIDEIKDAAFTHITKDKMILLSLGPTAKVLAFELFKAGYRVIDVGHIDMEYEMFLRGETKLTKVKYKYFNEINERDPEDCNDQTYQSQILTTI